MVARAKTCAKIFFKSIENHFSKTQNSGQIEAVMHLREKDDQYEEEDDDVVQEIDSNDVLVDSQEIFNFQN